MLQLVVMQGVSVALAFIRLLQFYKRSSTELKPRKPLRKLAAIKGIVFLTFLQQVSSVLSPLFTFTPAKNLQINR